MILTGFPGSGNSRHSPGHQSPRRRSHGCQASPGRLSADLDRFGLKELPAVDELLRHLGWAVRTVHHSPSASGVACAHRHPVGHPTRCQTLKRNFEVLSAVGP